jgi:hypothetical protein
MIAIFSQAEDSIVIDDRRQLQFTTSTFVDIGYRLLVRVRAMSCQIERHFARFANVPYHDLLTRQQWEQLWETDLTPADRRGPALNDTRPSDSPATLIGL